MDIVTYLIPKFADRRFESDNDGDTCLHCAAQGGHLAVMKYLIGECGFDPVTGNMVGYCLLHDTHIVHHLQLSSQFSSPDILNTSSQAFQQYSPTSISSHSLDFILSCTSWLHYEYYYHSI